MPHSEWCSLETKFVLLFVATLVQYYHKHARPRGNTATLVINEKFLEVVTLYECLYNQNSKTFRDKTHYRQTTGQKLGRNSVKISAVDAKTNFVISEGRLKEYCSERKCYHLDWSDTLYSLRVLQCRVTEPAHCPHADRIFHNFLWAKCTLKLCFPVRFCDSLRLYGKSDLWDRLRSATRDRLWLFAISVIFPHSHALNSTRQHGDESNSIVC